MPYDHVVSRTVFGCHRVSRSLWANWRYKCKRFLMNVTQILSAIQRQNNRCLYQSAKWTSELLVSVANELPDNNTREEPLNQYEILGKAYFDCKEYERCAHFLEKHINSGKVAKFLYLYSKHIAGENIRDQSRGEILSPKDVKDSNMVNPHLGLILSHLSTLEGSEVDDPYLLYLNGICLLAQKESKLALQVLIKSVNIDPMNWCVWEELIICLSNLSHLKSIVALLPIHHPMTEIFLSYAKQQLYDDSQELINDIDALIARYKNFTFLRVQKALVLSHALDYDMADEEFQQILLKDPHRLDDIDTYSNILYVMDDIPKLAFLAQLTTATDPFRHETCCVVANYYAIRSDHEKAIHYYQQALILNRSYLSAWTLMGHEFIELKNTHAAIECYRRAVDANKSDYRAWYGLGQAYEMMDMHYYSLYYYQRAASIRALDHRMWLAIAQCLERLDRQQDAIKALTRALTLSTDSSPSIQRSLALLHDSIGEKEQAVRYMKLCVSQPQFADSNDFNSAKIWLAKHYLSIQDYTKAWEMAKDVSQGPALIVEEARAIVRDAKSRLQST